MTDVPSRGLSSHYSERITDSGRMVFRWGEPDACVPREFHGDVASGTANYGQRPQEEIWTLITFRGLMLCLLSSAFVGLSWVNISFATIAVNIRYLLIAYAV